MKLRNVVLSMVVLSGALGLPGCEVVPVAPPYGYYDPYYDSTYYYPSYGYGVYPGVYYRGGYYHRGYYHGYGHRHWR